MNKTQKTETPMIPQSGSGVSRTILQNRKTLIMLTHAAAFAVALLFAFLFANNMQLLRRWAIYPFPILLSLVLPIKLLIFAWFNQYRGWWRYVGISDLLKIAKAAIASTIILIALWYAYGAMGERILPDSAIEAVKQQIANLESDMLHAIDIQTEGDIKERHTNLKGFLDILEVSRINQVGKEIQNAPINSTVREEKTARMAQLKSTQRMIEGVLMLDLFTTIMLLSGLRMTIRLYHEEFFSDTRGSSRRFLIIGAGNAGEALLREMLRRKDVQYEVVGFVDDDPAKQGMEIHGISVLGKVDTLPAICKKYNVDEIAIAIPSASRQELRRVVQVCQGTKIRFQTVPSITDIASGKLSVSQIRDVDINDLLGREVIQLDTEGIQSYLKNKVILVTGAGGSIGSEMCRQVGAFGPKQLLLLEQAENPLFFIERELKQIFPNVATVPVICDITDRVRVNQIFEKYRPQVVIHAAAHKHVPLMEHNPGEAIKNNVMGTSIIADASDQYGAESFVMISTDKAVNPTSIMGSSKRIAEMYIQDLNNTSKTHYVTVRFGNVLGSNGSVVPIFKQQIAAGGPVSVTHPEMRRYFMTIPEASQLVLQAASMGQGGEIFVLDMGEPVRIVDLARELITLSGFRPGEDIEIQFTGLRPGEKLFEELSIVGEDMLATKHPKIAVWKNRSSDREFLRNGIRGLIELASTQDRGKIIAGIKALVPEFIDQMKGVTG